ncbi:MAG: VCBS repeat-containing protein [Saprospiraceae bacterium]
MTRILTLLLGATLLFSCGEKTTRFERLPAAQTGIEFNNEVTEKDSFNIMQNEAMYDGGGVGVADLNNDGLQDLVFVGNKVLTRIYINLGDFKFKDITDAFDGLSNSQWLSGVAVVDINADGWTDLYFTSTMSDDSLQRKNQLWVNQGISKDNVPAFKEMADQYGIADTGHSMQAAFLDYDLDGDLDLYVMNNVVTEEVPTRYHIKIEDGSSVNNDRFYKNMGDGRFADATMEAGIRYEGFGLGLAAGDINKDGYPDIYVSNDYISSDLLFINQGDGTFQNETRTYLSYMSKSSMGNDMADVNNDGNLDIYTMDMMPRQYNRLKQTINGHSYMIYQYDEKLGYERQYVRNMLHLHNGFINGKMLPFSEVGQMAGIFNTEWSWSPLFADFDNDGDKDLLVTNGYPRDLTDKDFTRYKARMYGYLAGDYDLIPRIPVAKVSNFAFENKGGYKFADETEAWGMNIPSFSNGAAFVDLDNDGDLDYVTNNINDPAFVYRNNTVGKLKGSPNYLRIHLAGNGQNTLAIGATVELWYDGKFQFYEHNLTRGYLSSVDPDVHFGLGQSQVIDSIRITWPGNRHVTLLKGVQPNQLLVVKEADATEMATPAGLPAGTDYLFRETGNVIDYTHTQEDFIDFFMRQPIIQHKFSQIGPCMAKGDMDGDGTNDLVIGGSPQMATAVFLNKGGHFEKTEMPGLTETRVCPESDILVLDYDGDGDNDVIALSGGYANQKKEDYRQYLYENIGGAFERQELPLPPFPASVVRPFDFDKDGDMDLFIGARVERENVPFAPPSFVLVNRDGKFAPEDVMSFEMGMVTDAVWSDYDGDGWADILLAREWNSIAILKNENGKAFEFVDDEKLAAMHGFWFSIAASDLDNDGDDDYIIGNLGENHRFSISEDTPMRLYASDTDHDRVIDPITTCFWKDENGKMQEYPVNYLDEMVAQSASIRNKYTSYTRFSFATIDSLLDRSSVSKDNIFFVNTTSSYILWNEGGNFKWERLASIVQTAPLKKILVHDFNGDSQPDVFLGGNDRSYDVSTGYYDASKGVVFVNKGGGKFETLPPSKSGLLVNGQVESVTWFDGSTPLLVIGVNRDKVRVFEQISGK